MITVVNITGTAHVRYWIFSIDTIEVKRSCNTLVITIVVRSKKNVSLFGRCFHFKFRLHVIALASVLKCHYRKLLQNITVTPW